MIWGALTPQVLAEFFVNATKKLQPPLTIEEAHGRIHNYLLSWEILDITEAIVLEAVRGVRTYQMTYWDAQIWASARLNQIPVVLTEDFRDGVAIEGVRFVNPFGTGFNLEIWLLGSRLE
jgi:predicted nucleic acid-binding protein